MILCFQTDGSDSLEEKVRSLVDPELQVGYFLLCTKVYRSFTESQFENLLEVDVVRVQILEKKVH